MLDEYLNKRSVNINGNERPNYKQLNEYDKNYIQIVNEYNRRLRSIKDRYDNDVLSLDAWKEKEIALLKRGDRSDDYEAEFIDLTQFDIKKKGTHACTCISFMGAFAFLKSDVSPREIDWEKVIRNGASLWSLWRKESDLNDDNLHVDELLKMSDVRNRTKDFIIKEYGGNLNNQINDNGEYYYSLEFIFEEMIKFNRPVLVFSITGSTISIYYYDNKYWLFDSHNAIFFNKKRSSLLLKCNNKKSLCSYLRLNYGSDEVYSSHLIVHKKYVT